MATWETTTWIAVGASVLASLLLAVTALLAVRLRRGGDAADRGRHDAETAWEEVRRERIASARARSELHWLRRLAVLGPTDSVEASLHRVLESAAGIGEAAAAMLALPRPEGEPLVATFGLSAEESARELLGFPPGGGDARALALTYRYSGHEEARDEFRLRSGLTLPVPDGEGERLGTLAVFWRRTERDATEAELERLEGLAAALGPSLHNVFRFEELRQLADRDATGLPGRRTLRRSLAIECQRARRYSRPLSLLLLHAPGSPESVHVAAERLPCDVRGPDLVHHLGAGRFAVVLPESALGDAERVARRLVLALGTGHTPMAHVELRAKEDAVSLLERGEAALARAETLAHADGPQATAIEPRAAGG